MKKQIVYISIVLLLSSCSNEKPEDEKASRIVKQCIEVHGGKNYRDLDVSFDFRQFRVHLKHDGGKFLYERTTKDSMNNQVHDILTNDFFTREVNGKKAELSQKDYDKYKEGINAIAYFALLPYKLSEPAVILKYIGEISIANKKYDKIGVSFDAASGGKDHRDEFCYWISRDTLTMDYLSYASGGPRFRKAIKREKVDGVVFQDYENYELTDTTLATSKYDSVFIAGNAKLLSKIEQQNYTSHKKK
jgi:hypothetical protein